MTYNRFLENLTKLTKDKRLSRIFGFGNICTLNLWVLELEYLDQKYHQLLYGWVLPSAVTKNDGILNEWFISKKKWKNLNEINEKCKFRFIKLSYYNKSYEIFYILKELFKGLNLEDACKFLRIPIPKSSKKLTIINSVDEINKLYEVRPVIFLETKQKNALTYFKGINSPLPDSPAFMASLFRLNKLNIFKFKKNDEILFSDELFKKSLIYLKNDTQLEFDGTDSPRLGNIDLMVFPTLDLNQIPLVSYNPMKNDLFESKSVNVKISTENFSKDDNLLVRCRLRNNQEIIFDECKEFKVDKKIISAIFEAKEEIGYIQISIWERSDTEDSWKLFYENSNSIIKEIHTSSKILGSSIKLKSGLFEKLKNSNIPPKKIEEMEIIERGKYEHSIIENYQFDPWVPESKEILAITEDLFPHEKENISEGYFFPKRGEESDPGILLLIEWFNKLTKDPNAKKIIILDPFFDVFTIDYLIAKAESADLKFIVITNTPIRSNDDQYYKDNRYTRIRDECKKLRNILPNLTIYNLSYRKEQIFHDRYILVLSSNNEVINGYNLSNSLQRATTTYPLLITPIPKDLLLKVDQYLQSLVSEETEVIFPLEDKSEDKFLKKSLDNIIPKPNYFFSALLNNCGIKIIPSYLLVTYLVSEKVVTWNLNFILEDKILFNSKNFLDILLKSSESEFNLLWIALGEWLARIINPEKYILKILDKKLIKKIINFLEKSHELEFIQLHIDNKINYKNLEISHLLKEDFFHSLKTTKSYAELGLQFSGPSLYCVKYGADVLNHLDQKSMFKTLFKISQDLETLDEQKQEYNVKINIFRVLLAETIDRYFKEGNDNIKNGFLDSNIPFIRSIGAQIAIAFCDLPSKKLRKNLKIVFLSLNRLQMLENIHALAEWVNILRIKSNHTVLKDRPILLIFNEIRNLWNNISFEETKKINARLNGYGETNLAIFTTRNLYWPLIKDKKLTIDDVAELWFKIVFKRLNSAKGEDNLILDDSDEEFTNLLGYLLKKVSETKKIDLLKELNRQTKFYIHVLLRPFPRANYSVWRNAFICLLWIQTIVNCARLYDNDIRFKELAEYSEKEIWSYAKNDIGKELDPLIGHHFISFANEIKGKLKFEK